MVGIIPKPIKKTPKLYEFIPHLAFGLVVVVVLVYTILFYLDNQASKKLWDLEDKIAQVGTKEERSAETQILLDKQRISDFSTMLHNHNKTSSLFKFLEENCHPKVWFTALELNSGDSQVMLSGETPNFQTFGQQIAIFQNQDLVKKIEITDLAIGKSGQATFTFSLSLDPKIFQNNEPR